MHGHYISVTVLGIQDLLLTLGTVSCRTSLAQLVKLTGSMHMSTGLLKFNNYNNYNKQEDIHIYTTVTQCRQTNEAV